MNTDKELMNENNLNDNDEEIRSQIFAIEVRVQEIDAIIENYEYYLIEKELETLTPEEVASLKEEYKNLKKQRKELQKQLKKSIWDHFPVWMGIYAIFQFFFSFTLVMIDISSRFAIFAMTLLDKIADPKLWVLYLFYFIIPVINLLISLIILLKLKNKNHKKIFAFIYGIHGIEVLITIIFMISIIVRNS
jgi:hypothetical protein